MFICFSGLLCTQLILQQLFSYCNTLVGTLDRLQELGCGLVICDGDPACYSRLCQTTIIGSDRSDIFLGPASSSTVFNPGRKMALSDIVTWVVSVCSYSYIYNSVVYLYIRTTYFNARLMSMNSAGKLLS